MDNNDADINIIGSINNINRINNKNIVKNKNWKSITTQITIVLLLI